MIPDKKSVEHVSNLPFLEPADGISLIHTDTIILSCTKINVQMLLAEVSNYGKGNCINDNSSVLMAHANVFASWPTIKTLSIRLVKIIEEYEAINGSIEWPKMPNIVVNKEDKAR